MAWLGTKLLGQWVSVPVSCKDASGDQIAPDAAPTVTIYKANDTPITGVDSVKMPPLSPGQLTGFFNLDVQLGSHFSAGRYHCLVEYLVSTVKHAEQHFFEIAAGGNANGAYVAMFYYPRPQANYVVGQLDDGTLEFRRGPKL